MKKSFFFRTLICVLSVVFLLVISCETTKSINPDDPDSLIWELLRRGDESAKGYFLGEVNVNAIDPYGRTPLHYAAERKDAQLTAFFISLGANVNARDYEGQSPLGIAVENNDPFVTNVLALAGADIHQVILEDTTAVILAFEMSTYVFKSLLTPENIPLPDKDGKTVLHLASIAGKVQAVIDIISVINSSRTLFSINDKDKTDKNALDYALDRPDSKNHIETAEQLILSGAFSENPIFSYFGPAARSSNFNMRRNEGLAPIHYAVMDNHIGLISFLMTKKVDLNLKSNSGATALHEAIRKGHIEIISLLLENGADPNASDANGNTPLHTGIPSEVDSEVHIEIISMLLEKGADPNLRDAHGDTPLHISVILNHSDEVIQVLLNGGSDVHVRNINGKTPLYIAIENAREKLVHVLLQYGSDIFAADNSGATPFDVAFGVSGNILNMIITEETVNQSDHLGNTMLHSTVRNRGNIEYIGRILDYNGNVDARNRDGDTALHIAVRSNYKESGEYLVSRGANVFSLNSVGHSPVFLAFSPPSGSIRDWIINPYTINLRDGLGNSMLHYASQWNLNHAIPVIIRNGISVEDTNATGQTPIFMALRNDSTSTITVFHENNANINARDSQGNTLLHAAVRWNARNSIPLLISYGIDINVSSLNGNTPLHDSVALGMSDIESLFIRHNANLEIRNVDGNTPFMEAVRAGLIPSIEKLSANGADPSARNIRGDTPLHIAVSMERIDLVNILLNMGTSIHARNTRNRTPFQTALSVSPAMVTSLLSGDRIHISDDMGNSALHVALQERSSGIIIRTIVNLGSRVNAVDNNGKNPLRLAVDFELWEAARIIADSGADPFMTAVDNKTPAEIAFTKGNECLRAIFSGIAINSRDSSGNTILHFAARYGTTQSINLLLELGANKTLRNILAETPYDIAVRWNRQENANLLEGR
ncbi:MAG: ankyrin repeat domain-containing protein [Treponema sp.]|nr:ankyrin repeat domain-containing protein [Treponema sp.]